MLSLSAKAQDFKITGRVLDNQNRPVAGASVLVKGSLTGAIADADGSYSISASANSALIFSFMGMERKEELVNGRSRIDVTLSDEEQLINEVIVMGYNSKTKSELSSSVVTLSSERLTDVTSSNVASMLQGKAAGVMVSSATGAPGATPEILIRGAGSITAQATPLYVVDGIIGGNYNPNDVETLTVLKDA
ncbi:MAG: carboxypeptidase-like regulatory domain-containing protein, partial [Prevotellaceae bacterium]|nr:carboxypeptidase-like regulatory domain-containing protein [Prevotellaceae bacterium]